MHVLRIEHPVPAFDGWKKAFDSDPVGRQKAGVRRYTIFRPTDDPNYALVDLEFNTAPEAEKFWDALRVLWDRVEGTVMRSPQARLLEIVESHDL